MTIDRARPEPGPELEYIETETGPGPAYSVIWLHGLGADGHDFSPLVPALRMAPQTPVRFVFPHAPVRPITINGQASMRGWYDITDMDFERGQVRAGIEESAATLRALMAREKRRGSAADRIFIAGFSQGGAVALHTAARFEQKLAGVIALSTYLPHADSLAAERSDACCRTPIYMAHGAHDPLIPIALARRNRQHLMRAGYSVEWREYPIEHSVSPQEIDDIAGFLRACMGGG